VNLTKVHYLSGPIAQGASRVTCWSWTCWMSECCRSPPGFHRHLRQSQTAVASSWINSRRAQSLLALQRFVRELTPHPRREFAGITHPGLIGCLPSRELLDTWNQRESASLPPIRHACRHYAVFLSPKLRHLGTMKASAAKVAAGSRPHRPPGEHGGNCDIKNLSRWFQNLLPVYVNGGGLSMGDHFSQGDGEITFCGAIEMAGFSTSASA